MRNKEIFLFKSDFLSISIKITDKIIWKVISLNFRIAKPKRWKAFRNWKRKLKIMCKVGDMNGQS